MLHTHSINLIPNMRNTIDRYYSGILFLTTNRVRAIDDAFQSRIHVSLRFNELDADARRDVWNVFLEKYRKANGPQLSTRRSVRLTEAQLESLVKMKLNGRQIKNIVSTATALANNSNEILGYKHLMDVLDILVQFELEFNSSKM